MPRVTCHVSSLTTVLDRRDLSAEKTSTCEARLAAAPDLIRLGSFRATAFVKLFIRKKSAPPCPQVLAGGATENIFMQFSLSLTFILFYSLLTHVGLDIRLFVR